MNDITKRKAAAFRAFMGNEKIAGHFFAGHDAPIGSTKRDTARRLLKMVDLVTTKNTPRPQPVPVEDMGQKKKDGKGGLFGGNPLELSSVPSSQPAPYMPSGSFASPGGVPQPTSSLTASGTLTAPPTSRIVLPSFNLLPQPTPPAQATAKSAGPLFLVKEATGKYKVGLNWTPPTPAPTAPPTGETKVTATVQSGPQGPVMGPPVPEKLPNPTSLPNQEIANSDYSKRYNYNISIGMTPEQAQADASSAVFGATGLRPTVSGDQIASNNVRSLTIAAAENLLKTIKTTSAADQWFNSLPADKKTENLKLYQALIANIGGDAYGAKSALDVDAMMKRTGLPREVIEQMPWFQAAGQEAVLRKALEKRDGIDQLEDDLLVRGGYHSNMGEFGARYIQSNDQFVKKVDDMLSTLDNNSMTMDMSSPQAQNQYNTYRTYLTSLKTDRLNKYNAILQNSVKMEQGDYTNYLAQAQQIMDRHEKSVTANLNDYATAKADFKSAYESAEKASTTEQNRVNNQLLTLQNIQSLLTTANQLPDPDVQETTRLNNSTNRLIAQKNYDEALKGNFSTGTSKPLILKTDEFNKFVISDPDGAKSTAVILPKTFSDLSDWAKSQKGGEAVSTEDMNTVLSSYGSLWGQHIASRVKGNPDAGIEGVDPKNLLDSAVDNLAGATQEQAISVAQKIVQNIDASLPSLISSKDQNGEQALSFATEVNKGKMDLKKLLDEFSAFFPSWLITAVYNANKALLTASGGSQGVFFNKMGGDESNAVNDGPDAVKKAMTSAVMDTLKDSASQAIAAFPEAPQGLGKASVTGASGQSQPSFVNNLMSLPTGMIWGGPQGRPNAGECGALVNDIAHVGVGDSIQSKIAKMDPSLKAYSVQPGDVFTQNIGGPNGHIGFVNAVSIDPQTGEKSFRMTESNYHNDKRLTHDRWVKANDPSLVGFLRLQ